MGGQVPLSVVDLLFPIIHEWRHLNWYRRINAIVASTLSAPATDPYGRDCARSLFGPPAPLPALLLAPRLAPFIAAYVITVPVVDIRRKDRRFNKWILRLNCLTMPLWFIICTRNAMVPLGNNFYLWQLFLIISICTGLFGLWITRKGERPSFFNVRSQSHLDEPVFQLLNRESVKRFANGVARSSRFLPCPWQRCGCTLSATK